MVGLNIQTTVSTNIDNNISLNINGFNYTKQVIGLLTKEAIPIVQEKLQLYHKDVSDLYQKMQGVMGTYQSQIKTGAIKEGWGGAWQYLRQNTNYIDINFLINEGMRLVEKIREQVTGKPITYHVGVILGRGAKRHLYTGDLSLEQILNFSQLTPIWKSSNNSIFKTRIHILKREFKYQNENKYRLQINDHEHVIFSHVEKEEKAYEGIIRQYSKANKGNIYEAAVLMSNHEQKIKKSLNYSKDEIDKNLQETRRNTYSWVKGGDIGDNSIKFLGGNAPSLVTLSSLQSVLKALDTIMTDSSIQNNPALIQASLSALFEKHSDIKTFIEDSVKDVDESEKDNITKLLKAFSNI